MELPGFLGTLEPDHEGSIRKNDDTTLHKATGLLFMAYNSYDLIPDDPIIRFTSKDSEGSMTVFVTDPLNHG